MMYEYRKMTAKQREVVVEERRQRGFPLHRPPHLDAPGEFRIITATCFEHREILSTFERLFWFEKELFQLFTDLSIPCTAWCVLPNHYHALVQIDDIKEFGKAIGKLHGRTSFLMNQQDDTRGRRVWFNYEDRCMRSEEHYYTCLNYIHNNPVKHGYAQKWTEWACSSVHWYLETKGREWMRDLWKSHPVLDFGAGWDDHESPETDDSKSS
jgi:putative transposase